MYSHSNYYYQREHENNVYLENKVYTILTLHNLVSVNGSVNKAAHVGLTFHIYIPHIILSYK